MLKRKAASTPATTSKQQATLSKLRSILSKQHSTLLPKTATISNEFIVKFRPFDKSKQIERQQCRINIRHCRKNRSICIIRRFCFDIVSCELVYGKLLPAQKCTVCRFKIQSGIQAYHIITIFRHYRAMLATDYMPRQVFCFELKITCVKFISGIYFR